MYRIRLYVYETCKYHEPVTWNDAGDVRDYENCNAAMRNIDPDCNLFNFSNTKYYLEDDINEIIKRNNLKRILTHAFKY